MQEIDILKKNNFNFNKKYGQNFIFDKNLLKAIIEESGINNTDEILEIGAGAGTLTKVIASKAEKVVAYEIDENLKPVLQENLKDIHNVTVIFADALKTKLEDIEKNFSKKYVIVANLPYYITTPLIFKFVNSSQVKSLCIMVQKEVGQRLVATNKDKDFGAISIILDFYGDVKILRQVPRHMFTPAPNVDSCVVQINLNKDKYDVNAKIFENIVKSAFSNRRKTLANNLSSDFNITKNQVYSILKEINIPEQIRGDALSTKDFVRICKIFDKNRINIK